MTTLNELKIQLEQNKGTEKVDYECHTDTIHIIHVAMLNIQTISQHYSQLPPKTLNPFLKTNVETAIKAAQKKTHYYLLNEEELTNLFEFIRNNLMSLFQHLSSIMAATARNDPNEIEDNVAAIQSKSEEIESMIPHLGIYNFKLFSGMGHNIISE